MSKIFLLVMAGMSLAVVVLTGCTKDLSTGRNFTEFQMPLDGKAVLYFIRDDDFLATKLPYVVITAAGILSSVTELPIKQQFAPLVIVGRDMYVPIVAGPGEYVFRNFLTTERVSIKSGDIICFDVGSKFRGITIPAVERIESLDECKKLLTNDKKEGVQFIEAQIRLGFRSAKGISPEVAQGQILLVNKMAPTDVYKVPVSIDKN